MTKRKSRKQQTDEPVDRIVEIERLAALDPVDYEVKRAEAAKRLGIRASALDRVVAKNATRSESTPVRTIAPAKAAP